MAEIKGNAAAPTDVQPLIVTFKKRGAKAKGNIRKGPATPASSQSYDSSDYSSDYSSSENKSGYRIKRRKKNNTGVVAASSANNKSSDKELSATIFAADRNVPITITNDATKQSNWFDEDSKGALPLKSPLGTTRAMPSQTSFIRKNPDGPTTSVGPIKAPTNIRTTTMTDFAPDVCKDYKQTGYCGFGQNCKFVHDRSDYKQGWQLDREWENVAKGKKVGGTVVANINKSRVEEQEDEEDAMLEDIPFACIICKGPYMEPVVTRCGHYFCQTCALKRYRKDPSCAACGSGTNGVFNSAKKLEKLLDKKRERAAKRKQEAIKAGEEVSDEKDE
jgi:RING finger protein 113A